MSVYTKRAREIFAPTDASGARRSVDNGETQIWGTEVERGMDGAAAGRVDASSWADLSAIAGDRPGQPAIVYGPDAGTHIDPVTGQSVSNEGMYAWRDSPAGWRRVADVQSELVHADNVGQGSANAIQATVIGSFNRDPYRSLITLNFTDENTGSVTVSINGETPRQLVTNVGDPVPSGYLHAGMSALVQIDEDGNYRLFSYGDADASAAAAEAAQQAAEAAQAAAEQAAGSVMYPVSYGVEQSLAMAQRLQAQANIGPVKFDTVADLLADTILSNAPASGRVSVAPGKIVEAGGFRYHVAASSATDHHIETAGGVKLYVLPGDHGYNVAAFDDIITNAFAAFSKAPDGSYVQSGTYNLPQSVLGKSFWSDGDVVFTGGGHANIIDVVHEFQCGVAVIDTGVAPTEYVSGPSIVATKSGRILAFYSLGASHTGTSITGPLCYKEFDRITKTWGARKILAQHAGYQSRNQAAGVTPTGRIWVDYCVVERDDAGALNPATRSTRYRYSDDDGETWSAERSLSQYCPYPSLDNVPYGGVTSFANGALLIVLYNFHTVFTLKSTDDGETWGTAWTSGAPLPNANPNVVTVYSEPTWAPDNITEPTIVKIDENRLVMIGRSIPTGRVDDGSARLLFRGRRWAANTRYEAGMYTSAGGRVYLCTVAGTSGSVNPTHTSGTATDGTVTWQYYGTYSAWAASTAVAEGAWIETYSAYLYSVLIAGTTGTIAPSYAKYEGNETQLAYFKSDNAGASWSPARYVTWTSATWRATTSPPRGICKGGNVDIMWYGRSPDFSLYHVRMGAEAFWRSPDWAFSVSNGDPRHRLMQSYIASGANPYGWRTDCGYVDLAYLPFSDGIMYTYYDKPAVGVAHKTTAYSNVV